MPAVLDLRDVAVVVDGRKILGPVSWQVTAQQRWVVLGPNGGGKSTLVRVASLNTHPTEGEVEVLGQRLGRVDLRQLRSRIGWAANNLVDQLRLQLTAEEVVRCGLYGALEPWWHSYRPEDTERALLLLQQVGLADSAGDLFGQRTFGTLSSGERQRVLLARTLMADPSVVILDEPNAGLDMAARERLVAALDNLSDDGPPWVLVTHHVEEIPSSATHLLAVKAGQVMASGPVAETLSSALLSELFEVESSLVSRDGRFTATARLR